MTLPLHRLPPPPSLSRLLAQGPVALFLDFDGTLVELADTPDAAVPADTLPAQLRALSDRLDGRLAIVSGRAVEWLAERGLGEHVLSGTHGSEVQWPGRAVERTSRPDHLDRIDAAFDAFAAGRPGTVVERKALAAGLHFRLAPEHEADAHALAHALGAETGMEVQPGKMMVELRLPGGSKGSALTALMERPPFAGALPVMVGDDVTDEAAFAAATGLGGFGIAVGERASQHARHAIATVQGVHQWLNV